jgi:hypothetical protein
LFLEGKRKLDVDREKWRNRLVLYYLALNNYVVDLRPRGTTDSTPVKFTGGRTVHVLPLKI